MSFKLLSSSRAAPAARSHSQAVIRAHAGHIRTRMYVLVHVTSVDLVEDSPQHGYQAVGDGQAYAVAAE